jgi:hypothetical protein
MDPTTAPPAGGAEIGQVIGATGAAVILMVALFAVGVGHRSGKITWLGRLADWMGGIGGVPGWVAMPAFLAGVSLVAAAFGFYWDVSLHIDNGRDPGPLANPSHYFILLGLFGIFAAGWLAMVLPKERPGPAPVKITRDWYVPVGAIVLMACSAFALSGFPLDDVSHRLFGQDVTLWGPTHLMMLTGAAVSLIGILMLLAEGKEEAPPKLSEQGLTGMLARYSPPAAVSRWIRVASACGGFLIALSIYQAEFDFGVPQFRLLYDPVLVALAAGTGLVTARALLGRGGALAAMAFYVGFRLILVVLVTGVFEETVSHFPLYLAEAVLVEITALALGTARRYRFAVVSGLLVGTVGTVAALGWTHVWSAVVWPVHIMPEVFLLTVPVGIAAGLLGAFISGGLQRRVDVVGSPRHWLVAGLSVVVVAATIGYLLNVRTADAVAKVQLEEVTPPPNRTVNATVEFDPASAVANPEWLTTLAWQGQTKLINQPLEAVGGGVYRTTAPLPVDGSWKTIIRLQKGDVLSSVPVFLPADPAIPAKEIPAPASFERPFGSDHALLQREIKDDIPPYLWTLAGLVVLAIAMALFLLVGWSLVRIARGGTPERASTAAPASSGTRPAAGVA